MRLIHVRCNFDVSDLNQNKPVKCSFPFDYQHEKHLINNLPNAIYSFSTSKTFPSTPPHFNPLHPHATPGGCNSSPKHKHRYATMLPTAHFCTSRSTMYRTPALHPRQSGASHPHRSRTPKLALLMLKTARKAPSTMFPYCTLPFPSACSGALPLRGVFAGIGDVCMSGAHGGWIRRRRGGGRRCREGVYGGACAHR